MESSLRVGNLGRKAMAVLGGAFLAVFCQGSWAEGRTNATDGDNPMLVKNEWTEVRKSDYETALLRLPENIREGFSGDQKRIIQLLSRILRDKTMAAQARAEKLDQNPKTKALLAAEIDRFYAGLHMNKVEQDAAEAFTKREVEYTARAKEIYITDRKKYETPEQVSAAHILFDLKNHSQEEGLKLAQETRKKILAGADFGKVAKQISEDRGSANRMGDLGWFSYEVMVPEFSKVAFSLKNAGDVSEPVLTGFGWHLILLKGKKEAGLMPLEKAQEKIMEEQKQKFVEEYINRELAKIDDDSKAVLNEAAIDALYVAPPSSEALKQLMPEMTKKSEAKSGQ